MIVPELDLDVVIRSDRIYFESGTVDLTKESLSAPFEFQGVVGTVEFWSDKVIFHPPFGNDLNLSPERFVEVLKQCGEF